MTWAKLDDQFPQHPKVLRAGPAAAWLHVCGICYCAAYLTDGAIPAEAVPTLSTIQPAKVRQLVARLVDVGLWERTDTGYAIPAFLEFNPSREKVEGDREWTKRRKALYSDPGLVAAIKQRDQDHCRYCHRTVRWKDHRSERAAQLDHVTPRGPNTFENVVVACRTCNLAKGGRTPEDAGMTLLPPFDPSTIDGSELVTTHSPDPTRPSSINTRDAFEVEFAGAWAEYPRKLNRKGALRAYQARRRAGANADDLLTATKHYAASVRGKDDRYVLHGTTFYGPDDRWQDFLEPPAVNAADPDAWTRR